MLKQLTIGIGMEGEPWNVLVDAYQTKITGSEETHRSSYEDVTGVTD